MFILFYIQYMVGKEKGSGFSASPTGVPIPFWFTHQVPLEPEHHEAAGAELPHIYEAFLSPPASCTMALLARDSLH